MNILIACEESQTVCLEFRKKGANAFSCDIIPCSGGRPEFHIMQDVLPLLNGNCNFTTCDGTQHTIKGKWDLIIAHPPCTDLCVSGASSFEKKRANGTQRTSIEFFAKIMNCNCDRLCIENPVGIISGDYIKQWFPDLADKYNLPIKPTQIIQPWNFGDNFSKKTCLWLKGLESLPLLVTEQPALETVEFIRKDGTINRMPKWYADAWRLPKAERSRIRSKTFPGIAKAMADNWYKGEN